MECTGLTVRQLRGLGSEDDEYDDVDDEFDAGVPLREYLTASSNCDTIGACNTSRGSAKGLQSTRLGDTKMNDATGTNAAQAAAEKLAAKKAELQAKQGAAKDDAAAKKAEMEKAKQQQAERDAAIKAKAAAEKAKEKAKKEAEAQKAKEAKAKELARLKAEREKEQARIAKEKAAAKAKEDKEKAAAKAAAEKEKAQARALREKERQARAAERAAAGLAGKTVPADLSKYVINKEVKTAGGNASVDCGDATAARLRGMSLDAVYKEAATVLKEAEKDLRARYAHLNPGMIRMNLGNRVRAALAKGH